MNSITKFLCSLLLLFNVTILAAQDPELVSFSPSTAWPGEVVEISGNHLLNVTSLSIGPVPALILAQQDNMIRFIVGAGSSSNFITASYAAGSVNSITEVNIVSTDLYAMPSHLLSKISEPNGSGLEVSISADGTTIASANNGSVRIYNRSGNSIVLDTTLQRAGSYGWAIALSASGNTLVVGAPSANAGRGQLYIHERINGIWQQQLAILPASVTSAGLGGNNFGLSVAVSADGNTVIAGAPAEGANTGAVCTFTRVGNAWIQLGGEVVGSNIVGGNPSGQGSTTVLLNASGTRMAIFGNDNGGRGAVWIFSLNGAGWIEQQKISAQDPATINSIGASGGALSLDGRFLFVGAISSWVPPPAANSEGAVLVYEWVGNSYIFRQRINSIQPSSFAYFGRCVSTNADGSFLAVGEWDDLSFMGGRVRTFHNSDLSAGQWTEQPLPLRYDPPVEYDTLAFNQDDGQGRSVAVSSNSRWLIMGSPEAQPGFYVYDASSPPVISSFTPTTGTQGTQITITGQHLETTWQVSVSGVPSLGITRLANGQVRAVLGQGTNGQGEVSLTTKGGQFSLAGFTYVEPPQILSFAPISAGPGETITVEGNNLLNTQAVTLNGFASASFSIIDDHHLEIEVGNGTHVPGPISVTTSFGQTVSATNFTFLIPAPTITSFSPMQAGPYTTVTITGENLQWVDEVSFGSTPALSFARNEAGDIEATVGYGTTGGVIVASPGGEALLVGFQYEQPEPETFSLNRNSGPIGTLLSVYGNDIIGTTDLAVNATSAVIGGRASNRVSAIVMPGTTPGPVTLSVAGIQANSPGDFEVVPRMTPDTQQGDFLMGSLSQPTEVYLGERVVTSADGSVVALGDPLQSFYGTNDGTVHLFARTTGDQYQEIQSIVIPGVSASRGYIMALSADGTRLVVNSSLTNDSIFVYDRVLMAEWALSYKFAAPYIVSSISLSPEGTTLVMGRETVTYSQHIIISVYKLNPGEATLDHQFTPANQIPANSLAGAVALSQDGSTIVVGSYRDNLYRGALWIYRFDVATATWISSPKLIPNDAVHQMPSETDGARVGRKVAVSANGNRVVVSGELDGNAAPKGAVWSYAFNGVNWVQQGPKIKPLNMANGNISFGHTLTLSADGDHFAVGTFGVGEFWNYQWNGASWITEGAKVIPVGPATRKTTDLSMTPDGNYIFCASHNNGFAVFRNSLLVAPQSPMLTMDIDTLNLNDSQVVLNANSQSAGTISYSVDETSSAEATINGNLLQLLAPGILIVRVAQQPTPEFLGSVIYDTLVVTGEVPLLAQVIDFPPIPSLLVTSPPYLLLGAATSPLPITYVSSDPSVATVNGNILTAVGYGTATITAIQNGNEIYAPAQSVDQLVTVNRLDQTITFETLDKKIFGYDSDFEIFASSSSGEPITFVSDNPAVAVVNDNIVTITGAGVAAISAIQFGTSLYNAAEAVQNFYVLAPFEQYIYFEPLGEFNIDHNGIALEARTSSGLPVEYSSSNPAVASVSGNILTLHAVGETIITASQPGNNTFQPALSIGHPLTVVSGPIYVFGRMKNEQSSGSEVKTSAIEMNVEDNAAFPNPTAGLLTITAPEATTVSVTNQRGQLVVPTILGRTNNGRMLLDLSLHPAGIYTIKVKARSFVKLYRIVKH